MRACVVGDGSIGKRRAGIMRSLVEQVVTCDIGDKIKDADCFLICVPTEAHLDVYRQVSKFGKPIFLEKPCAAEIDELDSLKYLSSFAPTMVACNIRFSPSIELLKGFVDNSKSRLISFYANVMDSNLNRSKYSEPLPLQDIHEFDYLSYLFGPVLHIEITFNHNETSYHAYVKFDQIDGVIHGNRTHSKYIRNCTITSGKTHFTSEIIVDESMYEREMRHFIECIKQNLPFSNTLPEAIDLTRKVLYALHGLHYSSQA